MNTIEKHFSRLAFAALVGIASLAGSAFATDRVTMKDGKVLEGDIVREESCCVWIKVNGKEEMVFKASTKSIERNIDSSTTPAATPPAAPAATPSPKPEVKPAATPAPEAKAPAKDETTPEAKPVAPGTPKAAVLTLGNDKMEQGTVGVYVTAYALEQARPLLEEELGNDRSGVVVLRVCSPGGFTREVQLLSDELHFNYKKRFRLVAWIDSAISAASMTSHCIEEIYFTPNGHYGAATEYRGALIASEGVALETRYAQMESISARGGYNPLIARAMQHYQPLSVTVDENGQVNFYGDAVSGEIVINAEKRVLTLNATTAQQIKFSKGTAATLEELQALMGYQELQWIGTKEKGYAWPICKAEKWTLKFREQTAKDEQLAQVYMADYNRNVAAAQQSEPADRAKFIRKAQDVLNKLKRMAKTNWGLVISAIGTDPDNLLRWIEDQERLLKELGRK